MQVQILRCQLTLMKFSFGAALSDEVRSAVVPPPLCKTCRWCRPE